MTRWEESLEALDDVGQRLKTWSEVLAVVELLVVVGVAVLAVQGEEWAIALVATAIAFGIAWLLRWTHPEGS